MEYTPQNGLIVRHESLPGKRVQILNDGIRVVDGSSMVNIQSNAISITDGAGSCSINSGSITFHGIRNSKIFEWPYEKDSSGNPIGKFTAQTTKIDLSSYSSVMLVYDTHKKEHGLPVAAVLVDLPLFFLLTGKRTLTLIRGIPFIGEPSK